MSSLRIFSTIDKVFKMLMEEFEVTVETKCYKSISTSDL